MAHFLIAEDSLHKTLFVPCSKSHTAVSDFPSLNYMVAWQVLEITSICCSLVKSMNLTA